MSPHLFHSNCLADGLWFIRFLCLARKLYFFLTLLPESDCFQVTFPNFPRCQVSALKDGAVQLSLLHTLENLFGPSTEETKQIEGQLFLFEEAQKLVEELGVERKKSRAALSTENRNPGRDAYRPAKRD